jgi:hypothetical protein
MLFPHFTKNHAKSFPARSVFTSSCLVTASNNGYSSASGLKSALNDGSLPTELIASIVLRMTPLHGPTRNTVASSTSTIAFVSVAAKMCLPSRCLETALV